MSGILVDQDPAGRRGYGLDTIKGGAACLPDPRFRIQRPDEQAGFLGPQGWQPGETLLSPLKAWVNAEDLVLEIGPEVVDTVQDGTVAFAVPSIRLFSTVIWPVLPPSRGTGQDIFRPLPKFSAEVQPVRAVGNISPTPSTFEESPKPAASPTRGTSEPTQRLPLNVDPINSSHSKPESGSVKPARTAGWVPIAMALIVATLIGGAAGYYLTKQTVVAPVAITVEPTVAGDCDSKPLPDLFQCETDPVKLFQVGQSRIEAGNSDDAVKIFMADAQDGNGASALALAKMYDPASFQANDAITQADVVEAARYYEMAINDGTQAAAQPRAQLYQFLQGRAAQGDIQAPLILNNFWP